MRFPKFAIFAKKESSPISGPTWLSRDNTPRYITQSHTHTRGTHAHTHAHAHNPRVDDLHWRQYHSIAIEPCAALRARLKAGFVFPHPRRQIKGEISHDLEMPIKFTTRIIQLLPPNGSVAGVYMVETAKMQGSTAKFNAFYLACLRTPGVANLISKP